MAICAQVLCVFWKFRLKNLWFSVVVAANPPAQWVLFAIKFYGKYVKLLVARADSRVVIRAHCKLVTLQHGAWHVAAPYEIRFLWSSNETRVNLYGKIFEYGATEEIERRALSTLILVLTLATQFICSSFPGCKVRRWSAAAIRTPHQYSCHGPVVIKACFSCFWDGTSLVWKACSSLGGDWHRW